MEAILNNIAMAILCLAVLITTIAIMLKAGHYCYKCGKPVPGKWYDRKYTCPYCGSETKKTLVDRNIFVEGWKPSGLDIPINTRPEFVLNFFSTNPKVVESDSEYVVKTGFWRSLSGLSSGFRMLTIRPNSEELSLSVTNYWLFTHTVVIPFNRIDHIHPWLITDYHYHPGGSGPDDSGSPPSTTYQLSWGITLVLKDPHEEIYLFSWEKSLREAGGPSPLPHDFLVPSGEEKTAQRAVINRLQQITGAKIQNE